ncbi:MAG: SGNH/GDSL hydrolase family protein, partial [Oscillospiraceae bacterium]|nr:SGNH/GDSL hydrolase family protein [Candidatus Equicaccousia limihippi]
GTAPDFILVALGTNDIQNGPQMPLDEFFDKLCKLYPASRIVAVTPLERYDMAVSVEKITDIIKSAAQKHDIPIINGSKIDINRGDLPDGVHLNDRAASVLAGSVWSQIKSFLEAKS